MGYKAPRTYTLCGLCSTSMNPADATAYYIGGPTGTIGPQSGTRHIPIPANGIVRQVSLNIYSGTAIGTAEDWTISLTDGTTTKTVAIVGAATLNREWYNSNIGLAVTQGGYIQFSMTTPTWVTNPEGCIAVYVLIVEYE